MSIKSTFLAAAAALTFAGAAFAEDMTKMMVMDPYARSSTMMSATGAAFMTLMNKTDQDDRLIDAKSDIAERVELHTHIEDANGVMQMREVEDGFAVPAGGMHELARGGDHIMFLGLKTGLKQGDMIPLTLVFEKAGEIVVEVPVDLERKPAHGQMKHMQGQSGTDG
jgi:copper(I)-binding protein